MIKTSPDSLDPVQYGNGSTVRHAEKSVVLSSHVKRFETEIEEMNSGVEEKIEKGGFMSKKFQRRPSIQILLLTPPHLDARAASKFRVLTKS